jgi:hypothetical protein
MSEKEVYIIKTFGTELSELMQVNAVMDYESNIICWSTEELAYQYLVDKGFLHSFRIVKRDLFDLEKEIQELNKKRSVQLGIRIIDTVEF